MQGIMGAPQTDNAAFRTAQGGTAANASGLQVIPFLGGFAFIGAGSPNGSQYSITAKDTAFVTDAASGAAFILRPSTANSTVWS
jgi:hypothetical protein